MNKKYFRVCILLIALVLCAATVCETSYAASAPTFVIKTRAKTSVTIKINKKGKVTGYQIFVANSKKGKYKQVGVARNMKTYKITRLKKDKVYYIKIRSYKTKGYRISLGRFSKPVKVPKYKKKVKPTKKPGPTKKPTSMPTEMPTESALPSDSSMPYESGMPTPGGSNPPLSDISTSPAQGLWQDN